MPEFKVMSSAKLMPDSTLFEFYAATGISAADSFELAKVICRAPWPVMFRHCSRTDSFKRNET